MDFKTELIRIVEHELPELRDKIQAGAVDAETKVPYAAFTTPEEVPIRTIHGIAGYAVSFELAVFHSQLSEVEKLKAKLINALEGQNLINKRCYYKSSEYAFFHEYNLHSYTLTFKII
ncbi:MAG: hypothetical protein SNG81_04275 [Rikenellaceae bacterium]